VEFELIEVLDDYTGQKFIKATHIGYQIGAVSVPNIVHISGTR